jgi:hypothetical protein
MDAMYAIGKRVAQPSGSGPRAQVSGTKGTTGTAGTVAHVQLFPYESLLAPGQKQSFRLRLFDANGDLIREEKPTAAAWSVDQLAGTIGPDGVYVAPAGSAAGFVKASLGGVSGQARVRVIPPLPWTFDFEPSTASPSRQAASAGASPAAEAPPMWWTGAPGKVFQRTVEGAGNVLVRPRDETVGRRAKVAFGPAQMSGYTVEADVRATEQRRQRGDAGLINQRYVLVLFGNGQKLELHPWQAADEMTARVPFKWDANTWYRMKLRVDNRSDGSTEVRGKVWPTGQPEPDRWTIEKVDRIPHREGSPGIYADGISEIYFDNVTVYANK